MAWHQVEGNSNLIQAQTEKAYLIKLPKSEFQFWHPKKLVRLQGKNDYHMTVSFGDEWRFKIFRNGKGKYNSFEKIEEKEIGPHTLISMFGGDK